MDNDSLITIFSYLSLSDISNCFPVSKQFYTKANYNLYWKSLLEKQFNYTSLEIDYKDKYRQHYVLNKFLLETVNEDLNYVHTTKNEFLCSDDWFNQCEDKGTIGVQRLYLQDIKVNIPKEILLLTSVRELHINHIPEEIEMMANLRTLDVGNQLLNTIGSIYLSIPIQVYMLTNLQELYFNRVQLQSISNEIGLLTNLRSLNLSQNQLQSIPDEIGLLTKLRWLSLGFNTLQFLPKEIGMLTNLRTLELEFISTQLPNEIGMLTNLQMMLIDYKQVYTVPFNLQHVAKIRYPVSDLRPGAPEYDIDGVEKARDYVKTWARRPLPVLMN